MSNEKLIAVLESVEGVLSVNQKGETMFEVMVDQNEEYFTKSGPFADYVQTVYGKNGKLEQCILIKGHQLYFLSSEYFNTTVYSVKLSTVKRFYRR